MQVSYNEDTDVLVVQLRPPVGESQPREALPGDRSVVSDDDGPCSIEFQHASHGLNLDDVPEFERVGRALVHLMGVLDIGIKTAGI